MARPNLWALPGNGILGGVTLSSGTLTPDDPNPESETLWAHALREAIERQPGGDVDRWAMLAEQIRAGAGPANPLARPAAALIDWLRQPPAPPAMTTKSDRPPQPTMLQHELAARDSGANIGKAIIDHYADYFDLWAKDEQGRSIVETPAWTTPNAAGKTRQRRSRGGGRLSAASISGRISSGWEPGPRRRRLAEGQPSPHQRLRLPKRG
jgi:hypothetical protein